MTLSRMPAKPMLIRCRVLLLLSLCSVGHTRSNGDIPQSACSNMLPGHGRDPQESTSPYAISAESPFFIRSLNFLVCAESSSNMTLKGFYCQARKVNEPSELAGYYSIKENQNGHSCFLSSPTDGEFDTISHDGNWSSDPGNKMSFDWILRDSNVNGVKFRCTLVLNYTTFWTEVESDTIYSIENESVSDCCDGESLKDGCQPLCRYIREEPANETQAGITLIGASEDNILCPFVDAQRALRCTYWSSTAKNFDNAILEGCCSLRNVSSACMMFCSKEIIGTMDYGKDELNNCLSANPGLTSCLIFPGSSITTTTFPVMTSTISTSSPLTTASAPTSPKIDTTFDSTTTISPKTSYGMTATVPETTSQSEIVASRSTSFETFSLTTGRTTFDSTTTMMDPQTSSDMQSRSTSFNTFPQTTTFVPTTTTAMDPQTLSETTVTVPDTTSPNQIVDSSSTSSEAFPGTNPTELPTARLVFNINVTVDVNGATSDSNLRDSIFVALGDDLFLPGIGAVEGYTGVIVGVQYYEGSLITISEAFFDQQEDGSIPTVTEILDSLNSRLNNTGNEISNNDQTWPITTPIQVTRKDINGVCLTTSCGAQRTCVEVGPNGTACLCLDQNNEEIICEPDSSSGLSAAAIAGIVVGSLVLLAILALVITYVLRRAAMNKEKTSSTESPSGRLASVSSQGSYTYPDPPKQEPVYMDISGEDAPPALPPSRIPTLPSHSVGYDAPSDGEKFPTKKFTDFRENEEGYMEPVVTDEPSKSKPEKGKASTEYTEPYTVYQANAEETGEKRSDHPDNTVSKESTSPKTVEDSKNANEYTELDGYQIAGDAVSKSEESKQGDPPKSEIEKDKSSTEYTEPYAVYQANAEETGEKKIDAPGDAISNDPSKSNLEENKASTEYTEPYAVYEGNAEETGEKKVNDAENSASKKSASSETKEGNESDDEYIALDGYHFAGDVRSKSGESKQDTSPVEN